jgi:hypothetical protein
MLQRNPTAFLGDVGDYPMLKHARPVFCYRIRETKRKTLEGSDIA